MVETVITSSALIVVILLIRLLCKGKISRRLQYGLWVLVAVRLLIPFPFSAPAPVSLMNAVDLPAAEQYVIGQILEFRLNSTLADLDPSVPHAAAVGIIPDSVIFGMTPNPLLGKILHLIWIGGIAVVGVWFAIVNITFYTKLKKSRKKLDLDECRLVVYVSDDIISPCLFGFIRPAIYLPRTVSGDERKARHAVTHELCHYAQLDHLWSLVRGICIAVYWFHPLVWVAAVYSRLDCELACDELAVKRLGEGERLAYGQTLVELVSLKVPSSALLTASTTMTSNAKRMKERVGTIAKSSRTRMAALVAVVLVLCITALCTFTGAAKDLTAEQAADRLVQSIRYEDGQLSFTLPRDYRNTEDWNIYVYGRVGMGNTYGSVHFFDDENMRMKWEAGRQYFIDMTSQDYDELQMDIYMRSDADIAKTVDLLDVMRSDAS